MSDRWVPTTRAAKREPTDAPLSMTIDRHASTVRVNEILVSPTTPYPSVAFPTFGSLMHGLVYPHTLNLFQIAALTPEDAITAFRMMWLYIRNAPQLIAATFGYPSQGQTCWLMALRERIVAGGYYPVQIGDLEMSKDNVAASSAGRSPPYKDANGGDGGLRNKREQQFRTDWEETATAIDELKVRPSFERGEPPKPGQIPEAVRILNQGNEETRYKLLRSNLGWVGYSAYLEAEKKEAEEREMMDAANTLLAMSRS